MNQDWRGRTALVTGGAIRLGRAMAVALAERGVNIALHYHRSHDDAVQTAEEIRRHGVDCRLVRGDLSEPLPAIREMFERLEGHGLSPDILINSASLFLPGDLEATTEADWDRQFALNLKAPFFLAQTFAARLRERAAEGAIVNICDWRGLRPVPGHDAYTLTKAGLVALTRMLALELAPAIRVNGVAPGAILPTEGDTTGHSERSEVNIPLRRGGSPTDFVRAVMFLVESPFVTGEVIAVDGGEGL